MTTVHWLSLKRFWTLQVERALYQISIIIIIFFIIIIIMYSTDIKFLHQLARRLLVAGCQEHPMNDMSAK